jgi:hypothetical protein
MDLHPPDIDFIDLARGLGVQGTRVTVSGDLQPALMQVFSAEPPYCLTFGWGKGMGQSGAKFLPTEFDDNTYQVNTENHGGESNITN